MKALARRSLEKILWWQVARLRKKNSFKVIAVAGSSGKTSTKLAIAEVLSAKYSVRYQHGNYNVPISVPLIFFGRSLPSLFNPVAWFGLILKNEISILQKYDYDFVVIELGTDRPGDLEPFKQKITAELGVLTAIAPEHMENFHTLDAVAKEELMISAISEKLLYNKDLCPAKYLKDIDGTSYAIDKSADIKVDNVSYLSGNCNFTITVNNQQFLQYSTSQVISHQQLYSLAAAVAVGKEFFMDTKSVTEGLDKIRPVNGRMQQLNGIKSSTIIDDSYNASPEATLAALEVLYSLPAPHKIALLGNMNELGDYSEQAHTQVGKRCDPKKLDLVVTIGPDANNYLAAAAENQGCQVERFDNPYTAGEFIKKRLKPSSLILVKGSQNKVFAEEAIKSLLADPADTNKLVRQSKGWLKKKQNNFRVK